jgi:hypothetical protein
MLPATLQTPLCPATAADAYIRTWAVYVVHNHVQLPASWLRADHAQQLAVAAALAAAVRQCASYCLQHLLGAHAWLVPIAGHDAAVCERFLCKLL